MRKKSFSETHPDLAQQLDPKKNNGVNPDTITAAYTGKIVWTCKSGHEWSRTPRDRVVNSHVGCPKCISLFYTHPELARQLHTSKNGTLTAFDFTSGSNKRVWWKCPLGKDHEWQQVVKTRVRSAKEARSKLSQCLVCAKRVAVSSNCLETTHPRIAKEWDHQANKHLKIDPSSITSISRKKVAWKCENNHRWHAVVRARTSNDTKCPGCPTDNNLTMTHPVIAKEFHRTKNGDLRPENFTKGSEVKIIFQCSKVENHEWEAYIYSRTAGRGCPFCDYWSVESVRLFILSILPLLDTLDPPERYSLFQQNGALSSNGKSRCFIKNFVAGKVSEEMLDSVINDSEKFDEFVGNQMDLLSEYDDELPEVSEGYVNDSGDLPIRETKDVLAAMDSKVIASADAETVEFFVHSAVAKIWRHFFFDEEQGYAQLQAYQGDGEYPKQVMNTFLGGYDGAKNLIIPEGYNSTPPNFLPPKERISLMQRYVAHEIKIRRRFGNWSGTGAGKTLSAILAARVIGARLTVICCPNNVIDTWKNQIKGSFPDSKVYTSEAIQEVSGIDSSQYLILNYEFFQQSKSEAKLKGLVDGKFIDFIVIDEIHFSKQRTARTSTKRKQLISAFLSEAAAKNKNLAILGMSATPVINTLFEGKTLIELITGIQYDDLNTKTNVSNCISLYKMFIRHGIRYTPRYSMKLNRIIESIDCSNFLPEIKQQKSYVELEAILTKAKLPFILEQLRAKTIVYTQYRTGIEIMLFEAISQEGWRVAFFNGEKKQGLNDFIDWNVDILIATECISTGVDGLQTVCNRLIVNCLPWTHARYKQLIGRIYRQGQKNNRDVDIIIPLTFVEIGGERWSWCEYRWERIQYKKTISDAAVDGVIPEGHLRKII